MRVAYLPLFRFDRSAGRHGRMNDALDTLSDCDVDFDHSVVPVIEEENVTLSRLGLSIDDLWGSRLHNIEALLSARSTYERLVELDPDVLHVISPGPIQSAVARATKRTLEIPVVCGPNIGGWYPIRSAKFWEPSLSGKVTNRISFQKKKASLRLANPDHVLTFSEYHSQMVASIWNDEENTEILLPAVAPQFSREEHITRDVDLLYVGETTEQKGYDSFLRALRRLDGEMDLRVDVVGGEPETVPEFETIDARIHGVVPRDELPTFYNRTKLFVCLASDEMGPNTLVEAFSCGTPAIVNDELGMREYLRDGNGRLCDREDVDDVVETMKAALAEVDGLIANAEQAAGSYDICRTIDQLGRIYAEQSSEG